MVDRYVLKWFRAKQKLKYLLVLIIFIMIIEYGKKKFLFFLDINISTHPTPESGEPFVLVICVNQSCI